MHGLVKVAGEWVRPSEIIAAWEDRNYADHNVVVKLYFRNLGGDQYLKCSMKEFEEALSNPSIGPYR